MKHARTSLWVLVMIVVRFSYLRVCSLRRGGGGGMPQREGTFGATACVIL
jgi:hypothetical protein